MNYFITVFYSKDLNDPDGSDKRSRTWGYYRDLTRAEQAIYENWTDMYECGYYNLALIEAIDEGILSHAMCDRGPGKPSKSRWWFTVIPQFDKDGCVVDYVVGRTSEPAWAKNIIGYALG